MNVRSSRLTALLSAAIALHATAAAPACTRPEPSTVGTAQYEELIAEIDEMGPITRADFTVGGQSVFRKRPRGTVSVPDRLLPRLSGLRPRIEALKSHLPRPANRPVLIVESRLTTFGETIGFTDCASVGEEAAAEAGARTANLAQHFVIDEETEFDDELAGLCLVVIFPHRVENERMARFVLAHEWMHTLQNAAYSASTMDHLWWLEGSADWFAHKVVDDVTERDEKIADFYRRQPDCSLTDFAYEAQPFFFWGEQAFTPDWVFSVGLGANAYLRSPGVASEILPPDRWLDWAVAQSDQTITMPDGRDLPATPVVEPLDLTRNCEAAFEAPPLSPVHRELRLPENPASLLRIEAGEAMIAIRGAGGDWQRITGSAEIEPPASPATIAAISPSGRPLSAILSFEGHGGAQCSCMVGRWMEVPASGGDDKLDGARQAVEMMRGLIPSEDRESYEEMKRMLDGMSLSDRFHFRDETIEVIAGGGGNITWETAGPVLTIQPGGRFILDDPHTVRDDDTVYSSELFRHTGRWTAEGGVLSFDIRDLTYDGYAEGPLSDGPQRFSGYNDSFTAQSFIGGGGQWTTRCEAGRLILTEHNAGWSPRVVELSR